MPHARLAWHIWSVDRREKPEIVLKEMSDLSSSGSAEHSPLLGRRRPPAHVPIPTGSHGGTPSGVPYSVSAPTGSAPLVNPILDEYEIASSFNSESSAFLRRKEAAKGGVGRYQSLSDGLEPRRRPRWYREIGEGDGLDEDSWHVVPYTSEHKREEHPTSCVLTLEYSSSVVACLTARPWLASCLRGIYQCNMAVGLW